MVPRGKGTRARTLERVWQLHTAQLLYYLHTCWLRKINDFGVFVVFGTGDAEGP